MSFIGQTSKFLGNTAELKFQAVLFGRDAFYIEGVRILKIDGSELIFRAARSIITVSGDGLEVKELSGDSVSVLGKINGFSVSDL